jgi:hypothetical protein
MLVGLLLLSGALVSAYRGGCAFDGAQTHGDPALGQMYYSLSQFSLLGELGAFGLVAILSFRSIGQAAAAFVLVVAFAGSASTYLLLEAETRGTIACEPGKRAEILRSLDTTLRIRGAMYLGRMQADASDTRPMPGRRPTGRSSGPA